MWAEGIARRMAKGPGNGALLVERLVSVLWRDGYACGVADQREKVAAALGIGAELELEAVDVEPLNSAERLQRRRR